MCSPALRVHSLDLLKRERKLLWAACKIFPHINYQQEWKGSGNTIRYKLHECPTGGSGGQLPQRWRQQDITEENSHVSLYYNLVSCNLEFEGKRNTLLHQPQQMLMFIQPDIQYFVRATAASCICYQSPRIPGWLHAVKHDSVLQDPSPNISHMLSSFDQARSKQKGPALCVSRSVF